MSSLSRRLKTAVEKSPFSPEEIDEKLSLPTGSTKKFITGQASPDTDTVNKLAELLNTTADKLLFGVEKIGEMKAIFPKEADPIPTPMSDWRFLTGVIMIFIGVAGALLMFMMYSGENIEMSLIFDILGLPLVLLLLISVAGVILCTVTSILSLRIPKKKNKKKDR